MTRPGTRLRALAARVCSDKTMERLIDPVIGDLQAESASAIGIRRWLALLAGYVAFAKVSVWCGLFGLREARRNWSDEDRQGLLHTVWSSACAIAIVTVPLWLLQLPRTRDMLADESLPGNATLQLLMIYLLPSILPLALPVGLALGAALATQRRTISKRLIAALMLFALGMSVTSLVTLGWLTPWSNQSYREALIGRTIPKGDRELTLIELANAGAATDIDRQRRLLFELHRRVNFAAAPITFSAFALVIAARRRSNRVVSVAVIMLAAFGYYVALWMGTGFSRGGGSPALGAWIPQIVLVLTTVLVSRIPAAASPRYPSPS
jgi:hypothetical protein